MTDFKSGTLGWRLEEDIKYHRGESERRVALAAQIAHHFPLLLEVPAGTVYAYSDKPGISIYAPYGDERKEFFAYVLEALEGLTGQARFPIGLEGNMQVLEALLEMGCPERPFSVVFKRSLKKKCRTAKVTQTQIIEICGELDPTKYDSIEYLNED